MKEYSSKNIIITGGSTGLGYGLAKSYLEMGSQVYVVGFKNVSNINKMKKEYKSKFRSKLVDLTQQKNIEELCADIKKIYKRVDIIIHCLGGGRGYIDPLIKFNNFKELYLLNIGIGAEINRKLIPLMSKGGNILHIGSTASVQGIGSVGYNTVKAGLKAYVKSLSSKMIGKNIVINSILPGAFIAPGNSFDKMKKNDPKYFQNFEKNKIKVNKISTLKDLIPIIIFMTSKRSKMLAGSNVLADACETNAY